MKQAEQKERYEWVDVAKGLGMSLVILFHAIISLRDAKILPADGVACAIAYAISSFAMPVFMFLAGLFVRRRLDRGRIAFLRPVGITIAWPYILWGSLVLFFEWLGQGIRNPVDTSAVDITLLWTPIAWLWFLWALGIYYLIAAAIGGRPYLFVSLGVAALFADGVVTLSPFGHKLAHFLIFYAVGVAIGPWFVKRHISAKIGTVSAMLFLPLIWLPYAAGNDEWSLLATGAAITGTISIIAASQNLRSKAAFTFIGRRSMPIYVSHIFFITAVRIALTRVLGIHDAGAIFVTCLVAAFCGPLILIRLAEQFRIFEIVGFGRPVQPVERKGVQLRTHQSISSEMLVQLSDATCVR